MNLKNAFDSLLESHEEAKLLINTLKANGELLLIGGAVREFFDSEFSNPPRDFDIVINTTANLDELLKDFNYTKNSFGGYKIIADLEFDVWKIEDTWAFKENLVTGDLEENLQNTVFLNIDSIVYNLNKDKLYSKTYEEAMQSKTLEIVLEDNPCLALNFVRALVFKEKYGMDFGENLKKAFRDFAKNNLDEMIEVQLKHYKCIKISKEQIEKHLTLGVEDIAYWRYQLVCKKNEYFIYEVYCDKDDKYITATELPSSPYGSTQEELISDLENMIKAKDWQPVDYEDLQPGYQFIKEQNNENN